jgi:hypothetical protein
MPSSEIGIRLAELSLKAIAMGVKNDEIPESLRFWWFEGDALHFDAPRYAKLRGITVDEALVELQELGAKALPDKPITVQD